MQEALDLMTAMTGDTIFEKSIENTKIKEAHYMCDVIHAMIDEGVERGIQQGLQRGIQQGIQEGFQRGFQEGFQEGFQKGKLEGIQEGIQKGIKKGKLEGANIIIRLYEILLNEGSMDKFKRATKDENYRYELLKEYDLLKDFS